MSKSLTQEEAIQKIQNVHGDTYDLSKVEYVKASEPLILSCKHHGEFKKSLNRLTKPIPEVCPDCALINRAKNRKNKPDDVFRRANEAHNGFYSYDNFDYVKMKDISFITCPIHGDFPQNMNSHVYQKTGCPNCSQVRSDAHKFIPYEEVLKRSKEIHNNFYSYDKVVNYKKQDDKYIITCPIHGDFPQTFNDHLSGRGCKKCGLKKRGEKTRLSVEEAYQRCVDAHGDKYEYPNFEYNGDRHDVVYICKEHGEQRHSFVSHWRGHGCKQCSCKGYKGLYNTTLAERHKEEWKTTSAILYYVKLETEEETVFKIGITTDTTKSRLKAVKAKKIILKEININLYDAVYLEDRILKEFSQYKVIPSFMKQGRNECFNTDIQHLLHFN